MSEFMIVEDGQPPIKVVVEKGVAPVKGEDVAVVTARFSSEVPAGDLEEMAFRGDCCAGCRVSVVGRGYEMNPDGDVVNFWCTTLATDDIQRRPCGIKAGLDVV